MKKPWSGRFRQKTSGIVDAFTESITFDNRLWEQDIRGSIAHARMLARQGVISAREAASIVRGLRKIGSEIKNGNFAFTGELEDIHMNIEARLTGLIGSAGKKLHTARSRNDQVALDLRLYLREETHAIISLLRKLQKTFLVLAERYKTAVMPGYTHLQRAQPVLLAHHLLAYIEMFARDRDRFQDSLKRLDVSPLGACALSGTSLPTDRFYTAGQLGFGAVSRNSIDSVSDRDFALEFLSCAAIAMMHLSRLAEELILWSTEEFRFAEISERFTTGSSIMPQKKNPDVAELIRGKTGRVYGNLIALLTIMKGLPLSYNRDMQEDKLPVFDAADTLKACLEVLNAMMHETRFNVDRMAATAGEGYATATDIAEYLVRKGIPFREAHEITGKIVLHCIGKNIPLHELTVRELRSFSKRISGEIVSVLDPTASVRARSSYGGTSPSEVLRQIRHYKKTLR
jgi:argininosuccinate lyase